MKRKFALGLAPLKIASKSENQKLKESLNAYGSLDNFSPPPSPFINRQFIDYKTEAALRSSCAAIVAGVVIPSEEYEERSRRRDIESKAARIRDRSAPTDQQKAVPKADHAEPLPKGQESKSREEKRITDASRGPVADGQQQCSQGKLSKRKTKSHSNIKSSAEPECPKPSRHTGPDQRAARHDVDLTSPFERPKTAPMVDSSELSYATPLTCSTDKVANYASTAVTSAVMTPARPSKRGSQQLNADRAGQHAQADAEAAEWMRRELEKRRQLQQQQEQEQQQDREAEARAKQPPPSRSSSRTRSFTSDIREYIRPRGSSASRSGSRPPSRDALERSGSTLKRRPSFTETWRSWTLQRKSSKSSLGDSRPGVHTSHGQTQASAKKEINLNRELPPLPSIDTWQDPDTTEEPPKKPACSHIATMVKARSPSATVGTTNAQVVDNPPKVERRDPRSLPKLHTGIVLPAAKAEDADAASFSSSSRRRECHSKSNSQDSCFSPTSATSGSLGPRSIDVITAAERMRASESPQTQQPVFSRRKDSLINRVPSSAVYKPNAAAKSTTSLHEWPSTVGVTTTTITAGAQGQASAHPPPASITSRPTTRAGDPNASVTNFSRKISCEQHSRPAIADPRFPTVAEVTALPPMPPKHKKSGLAGLRRVLSTINFSSTAANKQRDQQPHHMTWMERVELEGVKRGVLIQGEAAMAPFVRY